VIAKERACKCGGPARIVLIFESGDLDPRYFCSRECLVPAMQETKERKDRLIDVVRTEN
jgi:hypothetical protein